jgi:hypothetical protein
LTTRMFGRELNSSTTYGSKPPCKPLTFSKV